MQINNSNIPYIQYNGMNQQADREKGIRKNVNEMLEGAIDKAYDYSEEQKKQLDESISQKLKSGVKLTPVEMRYLEKTNPLLYSKVLMLQKKREILERNLKNCKSKQEVNDVINMEVSSIQKNDPDKEMKVKVIQNTEKEFKKTNHYKQLPDTKKNEEKGN